MRLLLAAIAIAALPALARAQEATTPAITVGGLPLPSIGLPLPSIGLPHPPMGLPPPRATPPQPDARRSPQPGGRGGGGGAAPAIVPVLMFPVFYAPPPGVTGTSAGAPTRSTSVTPVPNGRVLLDVEPRASAQLYVDGYYVGTPDDYREGLELPAGPHAIEVRAPGFETASTSVQVPEGRTITYRASLARRGTAGDSTDRPTPPDSLPAAAPSSLPSLGASSGSASTDSTPKSRPATYYVIPGCYMGNVPPADADLPPTCDRARAITIRQ